MTTAGPDVAALLLASDMIADPWQELVLDGAMGERPDGTWSAKQVGVFVPRQNGKGVLIEGRVMAGLFLFGEKRIIWSAHEYKTAKEGFLRVRELIESNPEFDRRVKRYWEGSGEEGIELKPTRHGESTQRLKFIARSRGSGRGFYGDCIILDEAQELTLLQMKAIFSTMSARSLGGNPQLWYLGTPPEDPGAWIYNIREGWDQERLAYFDWGLGDADPDEPKRVTLARYANKELWYQGNPALGVRISEEFCVDELATLGIGFGSERLGIWLPRMNEDTGWRVIPESAWVAALDPGSRIVGRPAVGVYVPPDRAYAAIGIAGDRQGGGRHVEISGDGRTLDCRPGTAWVVPRLLELERHDPVALVVDDRVLAQEAERAGLNVHAGNVSDMVTGCGMFYDGLAGPVAEHRDIRHIGQKDLTDAARDALKRSVGGSWAWDREAAPLAAVSLALLGHSTVRVQRDPIAVPLVEWR